jgi:hypothetical protein
MKMSRGKLLSVFLIYFFVQQGALVHSSTEDHSVAARTNSAFGKSNFTGASESDEIAVGSDQYDVQIASDKLTVATAPTKANPIVEGPGHSEGEVDGDQSSGPGVSTFILFFVVIAWLTTAGGPKEN